MSPLDEASRDHFFATVYEQTTAPFQSEAMTEKDVKAFLSLAQPKNGARIVDLGCGWGRHLVKLSERGYQTIGIERDATLSARANKKEEGAVIQADVRALPLLDESFDAAACFYSSLFFFDEKENAAALAEVSRILKPDGVFFLETANPIRLRRLGMSVETLSLPDGSQVHERVDFDAAAGRENGLRRVTRPNGEVLEGRYSVRYYAPGELEAMGRRVGLKLERLCGDANLSAFTRESRDLLALFRKVPR